MSERRTLLVVNPRASRVTGATRDLIAHALASVAKLDVVETEHAGHARTLAAAAAREGTEVVVALGGDGTVNEVANGLLDAGGTAALSVVPSGGVDVFARTLGIPNDTVEAADLVVRMLEAGAEPRPRACGFLGERAFLFNAGIGYDAAIVEAVDRRPRRKRRYGDAYFALQAVKTIARYPRTTADVRVHAVRTDGSQLEASGVLAIACASDPFTYVGSRAMRLCPEADPDSGLSMIVVERLTAVRAIRIAARALGRARHARMAGVHVVDRIAKASITMGPALPTQVDGEQSGHASECELAYRAGALRLLVPGGE